MRFFARAIDVARGCKCEALDFRVSDCIQHRLRSERTGISYLSNEAENAPLVVCLHGFPDIPRTWAPLTEDLRNAGYHVVCPWLPGYAPSSLEGPLDWPSVSRRVLALIDELSPTEPVYYVGHDWGGPVGVGALERSPDLLAGAVLLNTAFGAPTGPVELNPQLQAILAPLPADAELALSVSIFDQLPASQNDPASLSADVLDLYRRPVAESDNPIGPLSIFRMAATGPEHPTAEVLRTIDAFLAEIEVPAEIVWGENDPVLGNRLPSVMAAFPDAPVTRTESGHFLQEEVDSPGEIAAAIERVHEQVTTP